MRSTAAFEHLAPTRIVFGAGGVERAGEQASELGSHALVVCGRSAMRAHGILDRVQSSLRARGLEVSVFDGVSPDPKSTEVDAAVAVARRRSCDVLVGLGGGSALDAAKAAGVAVNFDSVGEIVGRTLPVAAGTLPVLAIPTTAGSGAEVTRGAIVTDVERSLKSGVRGDDVFPRIAIVDPDLTATLPPAVAAETGFDALTHAIETYVARKASPLSEALSERATALLGDGLRALGDRPPGPDRRAALSFAALLGGLTVANASTCLPHRLQQAMGSVTRLSPSHGRGLASVYRAWLDRAYPAAPEKFDRLAGLLGEDDVHAAVGRILIELGLDAGLRELGFVEADLDTCMTGISGNVENDPIDGVGPDLMRSIYEDSMPPRAVTQ